MIYAAYALMAGATIAIQSSINAKLGVLLNSAVVATAIAFFVSCVIVSGAYLITADKPLEILDIRTVPWPLWLGGIFSAFGVGMFNFLIPKMGLGTTMSYALSGQIIVALICSHYGVLGLPERPIDPIKIIGLVLLIAGVVFINMEVA